MPDLPSWWPPAGSHEVTAAEVRDLFAYLRTVTRPVMADGQRRILERVELDAPIHIEHRTAKSFVGRRLGMLDVLPLIWLWARHGPDSVSVTIGLRKDGRIVTTMGTPERRQQEWTIWSG